MDAAHQEGIEEVGERAIRNSNISGIRTSGCNVASKRAIVLHLYSINLVIQCPKRLRLVCATKLKMDKTLRRKTLETCGEKGRCGIIGMIIDN